MGIAIITALMILLAANIAATAVVLLSHAATSRQKTLQISLVWLVLRAHTQRRRQLHWSVGRPRSQSLKAQFDI